MGRNCRLWHGPGYPGQEESWPREATGGTDEKETGTGDDEVQSDTISNQTELIKWRLSWEKSECDESVFCEINGFNTVGSTVGKRK